PFFWPLPGDLQLRPGAVAAEVASQQASIARREAGMSRRSGIRADAERQRIALQRQAVRRECRRDGSRRIVSSEALRTGHAPLSQHPPPPDLDRKSTRLNSSYVKIS